VRTWTEQAAAIRPRAVLTERARVRVHLHMSFGVRLDV
jgi:hypothetical protein